MEDNEKNESFNPKDLVCYGRTHDHTKTSTLRDTQQQQTSEEQARRAEWLRQQQANAQKKP